MQQGHNQDTPVTCAAEAAFSFSMQHEQNNAVETTHSLSDQLSLQLTQIQDNSEQRSRTLYLRP
jgi:hypothetical protein